MNVLLTTQPFILLDSFSRAASVIKLHCLHISSDKFWTRWLIFNHFIEISTTPFQMWSCQTSHPACTCTQTRRGGELPCGSGMASIQRGQHKVQGRGDKFRRKYRREGVQLYTRANFFNFSICKFNFLNTQETAEYFGNRSTIRRMRNINWKTC